MNSQVVTVGVDGSRSSSDALRFALAEARPRGAIVRAVTVWQADTVYAGYGGILLREESAAHEKAAAELQDNAIQVVLRAMADSPLNEGRVVRGHTRAVSCWSWPGTRGLRPGLGRRLGG